MAYNFTAEKGNAQDIKILRDRLKQYGLIEFFPIELNSKATAIGISIPFKSMDSEEFSEQLIDVMNCLVLEFSFSIFDLFSGKIIRTEEIRDLPARISR